MMNIILRSRSIQFAGPNWTAHERPPSRGYWRAAGKQGNIRFQSQNNKESI
jgi:hypothetical protein